ncbi:TAXI family TRAP transporter solute-binding subunit [Cytobacillus firmus]|uniref:TAXI family TRAP transporter solute-binding subunit n=1 Tax=Cytobacillus firmus TaxID=1399 RepID=UPI001C8E5D12|nr:TAXI family TRAP transporter solute-binding subunit [Cytobacillus firmus]MBX9973616.1 TAXI family TRAP transporter solute-binding subunit [Cytobacillus firmus]
MLKKKIRVLFTIFLLMILAVGCGSNNTAQKSASNASKSPGSSGGLPSQMTWSVYDVGSGGYAEMSAIANVLTENNGSQIRMLPSASGVGRMLPLKNQQASVGKLGDEIQFSFEGIKEFTDQDWGPQDVRAYWAPISQFGFAVREDSDIKSIADLKGKKIPMITGNASVNIKNEAILAFAGLSLDDVEIVNLTSYAGQGDALIQGQIDVAGINPTASSMFEADSMGGIRWLEMDPDDSEGWKRVEETASWLIPYTTDGGAGMDGDTNVMGHGYLIGGYANQDPNYIYELLKSMDENFDQYKDALPNLALYSKDEVLTEPRGIPFHEGTIKFLEEKGLWDDEKQAKNDALIERFGKLQEAWDQTVKEAKKEGISEDDFQEFWLEKKTELVK